MQCDVASGAKAPLGGLVLETPLFVAHGILGPTPLAGWVVLAPRRHARWWWELTDEEAREVGVLAKKLLLAQRAALGAVHAYELALGDVLHHMHLHLVPRYEDTSRSLWGRAAFDSKPEQHLPDEAVLRALQGIKAAVGA